jgi:translation initiation factor 5
MINIPSYIDDPAYRYKMPRMYVKQVSRLNGAKVDIVNVEDIGKSLRV